MEALEERLASCLGRLNAAHRELVDITAEAAATGAWQGDRIRSLTHWLTWRAGVSPATAHQVARVAAAADTHPETTAVFAAGALTLDQTAEAVKAPPAYDHEIADLAPLATVTQIRTVVRLATPPADPTPEPEAVTLHHGDDGGVDLHAHLDADAGAVVDAALAAARDRLFHAGQVEVTWLDALLDVCHRSLDDECATRRERFRIHLHLDPNQPVPARWTSGIAVPDCIRRLITCDGIVSPTFVADGVAFSVGRTQRIVPERTRQHVLRRDHHTCRMPWCGQTRGLEIHHIEHWEDGGPTDTWNLVSTCRSCHRRHHRGEFDIDGDADDPDGLTYTDRRGGPITRPAPRRPAPTTGADPPPPQYDYPLGDRLDPGAIWFPDRPAC